MKLNLRKKPKKRLPSRQPKTLLQPSQPNICWSLDFMSDALMSGQRFRTVNIIDNFNREGLGIDVNTSLPAERVNDYLNKIARWRGYPKFIRVDNGSENISKAMMRWAQSYKVCLDFIEPGKPTQNGFIERFNRSYREEILDMYLFEDLEHVHELTDEWLIHYNYHRPHEALNHMTPIEFMQYKLKGFSTSELYSLRELYNPNV